LGTPGAAASLTIRRSTFVMVIVLVNFMSVPSGSGSFWAIQAGRVHGQELIFF
jgi:hypothetical protein